MKTKILELIDKKIKEHTLHSDQDTLQELRQEIEAMEDPIAIINSEFLNRRDMDDYMYGWNDALQKIVSRLSLTQK